MLSISIINVSVSTALAVYISKKAFDHSSSYEISRAILLQASERSGLPDDKGTWSRSSLEETLLKDVEVIEISCCGKLGCDLLTSVLTNTRRLKLPYKSDR